MIGNRRQTMKNAVDIKQLKGVTDHPFERVTRDSNLTGIAASNNTFRAQTTEDAPAGNEISVRVYDPITGVLDPVGAGAKYTDAVLCDISGGSNLNEAVPRLENGDNITVIKSVDVQGLEEWYCVTTFQASEDCVCEEPA